MGRKKIPSKLKLLKGSYRKERENPDEPVYKIEIPKHPKHLSKIARKEWKIMSKILFDQGLLTNIDKACLAAYCQSYGRWVEAELELKDSTLTIKTIHGNVIQNPLIGIANTALKLMVQCLSEFGMTPASRSKVSAKKGKKKEDPWSKFDKKKTS